MVRASRSFVAVVLQRAAVLRVPGATPDGRVDFAQILTRVFERALADGTIRADVEAAELGEILSSMTMEAILRWATGRTGGTPLWDSIALRFELILDGLRA